MKYIVNLINKRGISKIRYVEGVDIKQAQAIVEDQYPNWEVTRITPSEQQVDYYSLVKDLNKDG
tara:strand:- start:38 stop:229 length:192 start_codon:yes stop_codon:yes gene_type:complete